MDNSVFLAQSDTTVGFLSPNPSRLVSIKQRAENKPILQTVCSYRELLKHTRVPKEHKKLVRLAKKTSFIYTNKTCLRVVKDTYHKEFLEHLALLGYPCVYSSSANKSGESFREDFALSVADIVILDKRGFKQSPPSKIFKLYKRKKLRVR